MRELAGFAPKTRPEKLGQGVAQVLFILIGIVIIIVHFVRRKPEKRADDDSDEEEEDRPKKRRKIKKPK